MPPAKKAAAKRAPRKKAPRSKTQREEAARRARERRSLTRKLVIAGVLAVILAVVFVATRGGEDADVIDAMEASGACEYAAGGDDPPTSAGDEIKSTDPAEPGFYLPDDEVPPDEALVRAQRQGFVVLWYAEGTEPDSLQALSDRFGRELIVVPRASIDGAVTVTAWDRRLACESVDESSIAIFAEAFRDRGPEKGFL